jgi:hypothetical protein
MPFQSSPRCRLPDCPASDASSPKPASLQGNGSHAQCQPTSRILNCHPPDETTQRLREGPCPKSLTFPQAPMRPLAKRAATPSKAVRGSLRSGFAAIGGEPDIELPAISQHPIPAHEHRARKPSQRTGSSIPCADLAPPREGWPRPKSGVFEGFCRPEAEEAVP